MMLRNLDPAKDNVADTVNGPNRPAAARSPVSAHLRPVESRISIQTRSQAQTNSVPKKKHQAQAQTLHSPVETHASLQPQPRVQKQETLTGPPFVFDPNATYPDQNVQA